MRPILLSSLLVTLALPACSQTRRHTVVDYFKMLPARFFDVPSNERTKWLREGLDTQFPDDNRSVINLKNDFLRFPSDGAQGRLDVAVFRFHGQDTIAVVEYNTEIESTRPTFWRLSRGRLHEVTRQVFPFGFRGEVTYVLPRQGTTIRALKGNWTQKPSNRVLGRFFWRNGRFVRG